MASGKFTRYILAQGVILVFLAACKNAGNDDNKPTKPPLPASDTATVTALLKKANSFHQTNFDSMRYYAGQALDIARSIRFTEAIGRARGMEANYQRRKGNYEGAITIGFEVIHLYDSLHLWTRVVKMKNFLADVYKEMGGEKGTAEYLRKGLELAKEGQQIAEREKYIPGITMSLNEQGIILRDMSGTTGRKDLMDSAFFLYQKGIAIIKKTGEGEDDLGALYNNISQVYNEHYSDYTKALDYQMLAVQYNTKRNNQISLTHNYNTISEIYRSAGDMQQSNQYAHRMLALSKDLKAPFRMVNAYSTLTELNKKMKRYDSALYYSELGSFLSDSLNNLEKSNQIAESQTKYETGKKEKRISELGEINQLKDKRLWLAFGLVVLFAVLIGKTIFQNRRLHKQKAQITEQSDRLQWMMKELHHRVKNNLQIVSSLLNLQTYRLKDEESIMAIKESQLRVQAMSLMHQRLYQVDDVSMVNFKLYLADLVETLMKAYGYNPDDFNLQINIEKEMLDVDTVMPMGLLVNEIITNSFKYAYQQATNPSLVITMRAADKQLQLEVSDNGPGMPATADNKEGFGKKLILALTKQLKATCSVNTENGTSYNLIIPYNQEKIA